MDCGRCGRSLPSDDYFDAPGICKVCFESLTPEAKRTAALSAGSGRIIAWVDGFSVLVTLAFIPFSLWLFFVKTGWWTTWWVWAVAILGWYGMGHYTLAPRKFVVTNDELTIHWWWRPRVTHSLLGQWPFTRDAGLWTAFLGCEVLTSASGAIRIRFWPDRLKNYKLFVRSLGLEPGWLHGWAGLIDFLGERRRRRKILRVATSPGDKEPRRL